MPKIVIAPQEFKGSLSAIEIARAIEVGVLRAIPHAETVLAPVADGGDGTLQSLVDSSGGRIEAAAVTGPLGEVLVADWGALGDGETAVIEMARSSGLALLDLDDRDPRMATTKGVGELIAAALDTGHTRFIIGIGGSATNDGGAGMMQALGASLLDSAGRQLGPGGAALARLDRIDVSNVDPRVRSASVVVACDVNNPLCGPTGASAVFGPQKGATPEIVTELDAAFKSLCGHYRTGPGRGRPGSTRRRCRGWPGRRVDGHTRCRTKGRRRHRARRSGAGTTTRRRRSCDHRRGGRSTHRPFSTRHPLGWPGWPVNAAYRCSAWPVRSAKDTKMSTTWVSTPCLRWSTVR